MNNENPNKTTPQQRTLRIWQQNLNKSRSAQQHMLCNLNPNEYNIALLQEPVINTVNLTTTNSRWNIIYPTCHNND